MASLFSTHDRIVPTWLAAAKHLDSAHRREGFNLLLEIGSPTVVTDDDRLVMTKVDRAYAMAGDAAKGMTLRTVRNTIFPYWMYLRHGRPDVYRKFHDVHQRARGTDGGWGTYAQRLINFRRGDAYVEDGNQLERLISKLREGRVPGAKTYVNRFELNTTGVADSGSVDVGGEAPVYHPDRDQNRTIGGPCLSHISEKLSRDGRINLTAVYRNHYYCLRALGNLFGLMDLMRFLAAESEFETGTLSCLSTHAVLDVDAFNGVAATRALINSV